MFVRNCQKEALIRMLHFNGYFANQPEADPIWKVFIFDSHTQDLISPILKVNDLKEEGVTIYRNISALLQEGLEEFADAPIIFFLQPTLKNIQSISELFSNSSAQNALFINFSMQLPRNLLEMLASESVKHGFASRIFQLYDSLVDFTSLEENLFTFNMTKSFQSLYLVNQKEKERLKAIEEISQRLFCLFCTTGQVPIIRCSSAAEKGSLPSAAIARSLMNKIQDHLKLGKASIFAKKEKESLFVERPLLLVFDRVQDLITPLKHCWSYNQMIQDAYGAYHSNRITLHDGKKVDLDSETDYFWRKYSAYPTYEVAAFVDQELGQYLQEKEQISALNVDSSDASALSDAPNEALKAAMEKIPMLTQKKALIDLHTTLATALIKRVSENKLDAYILVENQLIQSKQPPLDNEQFWQLISPSASGTAQDRLRLALIFLLRFPSEALKQEVKQKLALPELNSTIDAFFTLKNSFVASNEASPAATSPTTSVESNALFSANSRFGQVSGKIGGVLGNLVSGIKTFLPDSSDSPIIKSTEALLSKSTGSFSAGEDQGFCYLDPKQFKASERAYTPDKGVFNNVVVFVVGGATLMEKNSLAQLTQKYPKLQVTLGSSEMLRDFSQSVS
jgi:hypothetical protein